MFAEITAFICSLNYYIHVTPNWFQFLLNRQKILISIDEIIIRFKLICRQIIAFVKNILSFQKIKRDKNSTISKKVEMFIDDPMVQSGKIFEDAVGFEEAEDYEKALSAFEQYRMYHPEDPRAYYEIASCYCYLENFDLGLDMVERALSMNNEYGEANMLRGAIFIKKNDYVNAIPDLQHANVLLPENDAVLSWLLMAYTKVDLLASAMICVKRLLAKHPSNEGYLLAEARLYEWLLQSDKAITLMEKVVANNPGDIQNITLLNDMKKRNAPNEGCRYLGMNN